MADALKYGDEARAIEAEVAARRVGRHADRRFSTPKGETTSTSLPGGRGNHACPLEGRAWLPLGIVFLL